MANTICHDGYCEPAESSKMTFGDIVAIGAFGLLMIAVFALTLYGVSLGYYPAPV